jgi:uncharacterized protein (TIGR00725 family)
MRTIIGVMGPAECDAGTYDKARLVGRLLAEAGYTLLCGGGTGAMEGAARGAREAGGLTLGILPGSDAADSPPNPHIEVAVFTGISHARNLINVLSSRAVIAIGGAHGTLSEIALAIKSGKPVVLLDSWSFESPDQPPSPLVHVVHTPAEAVALVRRLAGPAGAD